MHDSRSRPAAATARSPLGRALSPREMSAWAPQGCPPRFLVGHAPPPGPTPHDSRFPGVGTPHTLPVPPQLGVRLGPAQPQSRKAMGSRKRRGRVLVRDNSPPLHQASPEGGASTPQGLASHTEDRTSPLGCAVGGPQAWGVRPHQPGEFGHVDSHSPGGCRRQRRGPG